MARTSNKKETEITINLGTEKPKETLESLGVVSKELDKEIQVLKATNGIEVEITKVAPIKEAPKVKIKMAKYHRCYIGGTWYELQEGNTYNVPENVKAILLNAGVLLPL